MPDLKTIIAFLLFPAWLSAATTTVAQSILAPDGTPASGTALIRISAPCRSGTSYVGDKTISVRFTAGAFSVQLVPNDTCVPSGTSYTFVLLLTGGTGSIGGTNTWAQIEAM
jgi:hypothetical protein